MCNGEPCTRIECELQSCLNTTYDVCALNAQEIITAETICREFPHIEERQKCFENGNQVNCVPERCCQQFEHDVCTSDYLNVVPVDQQCQLLTGESDARQCFMNDGLTPIDCTLRVCWCLNGAKTVCAPDFRGLMNRYRQCNDEPVVQPQQQCFDENDEQIDCTEELCQQNCLPSRNDVCDYFHQGLFTSEFQCMNSVIVFDDQRCGTRDCLLEECQSRDCNEYNFDICNQSFDGIITTEMQCQPGFDFSPFTREHICYVDGTLKRKDCVVEDCNNQQCDTSQLRVVCNNSPFGLFSRRFQCLNNVTVSDFWKCFDVDGSQIDCDQHLCQ